MLSYRPWLIRMYEIIQDNARLSYWYAQQIATRGSQTDDDIRRWLAVYIAIQIQQLNSTLQLLVVCGM